MLVLECFGPGVCILYRVAAYSHATSLCGTCILPSDEQLHHVAKLSSDVWSFTSNPFAVSSINSFLLIHPTLQIHDILFCRLHIHHRIATYSTAFTQQSYIFSTIHSLHHLYLINLDPLTPPPPYTTHPTVAQPAATMPQDTLTSAQKIEMVQAELEVAKLRLRQQARERRGLERVAPSRAAVLQRLAPKVYLGSIYTRHID